MKQQPFVAPKYQMGVFNCPFCNAYAKQQWYFNGIGGINKPTYNHGFEDILISVCAYCNKSSIWFEGKILYPKTTGVPMPNADLNEDIQKDYIEAMNIFGDSPRAACALLRLAIQKLCVQLGEKGKNVNDDIGKLVKNGLPVVVQQSLDIVRVVGNNAVHPGELNIDDNPEIASSLFELINFIAEKMITEPKTLNELYSRLPTNAIEGIKNRDKKTGDDK